MNRRIEDLGPVVQGMCRQLTKLCEERGIKIILTSTLRTEAEQLALFAQGRKNITTVNELRAEAGIPAIDEKDNRVVTRLLTSLHQSGSAFDICIITPHAPLNLRGDEGGLLNKGGQRGVTAVWDIKADINENNIPDYEEVGEIGESLGLEWGGRFKFKDYCHFQYTVGLTLDDLKAGKRPSPVIPAKAGIQGQERIDSCFRRNDNPRRYDMFTGKKTYIIGAAMVLYGIAGIVLCKHDFNSGAQLVLEGLGFIGLRLGVAKT